MAVCTRAGASCRNELAHFCLSQRQHVGAELVEIDAEVSKNQRRHPWGLLDDPKQEMLGPHDVVGEGVALLTGERQHLPGPSGEGGGDQLSGTVRIARTADLRPHLAGHDAVLGQHRRGDLVVAQQQPEEDVLGPREVVAEACGLPAGNIENPEAFRTQLFQHNCDATRGARRFRVSTCRVDGTSPGATNVSQAMGSLIKKRRKRMRKKKHKKMLKATRWQRRAAGK